MGFSWRPDTKALVSGFLQGLPCFLAHPEPPVPYCVFHFALHLLPKWALSWISGLYYPTQCGCTLESWPSLWIFLGL